MVETNSKQTKSKRKSKDPLKRMNLQKDICRQIREKRDDLKPVSEIKVNANPQRGCLPGKNGTAEQNENLTAFEIMMKAMADLRDKIEKGGDVPLPKPPQPSECKESEWKDDSDSE